MPDSCNTPKDSLPFKERLKTRDLWKTILFTVSGGLGGFLYYHFIGCASGTCAITGNPYASIAMGSFLGYFIINRPCAC
ncbi:MAG: hypothetical protein WCK34_17715 [Bacteroidota bacterium]